MADERKQLLLNLISDVKSRLDGKVDSLTFPIPQFIVIGKQSVGKSRLIEALAGETFNFVSGTLGSRRPTVLEFRNDPTLKQSQWSIFNEDTKEWRNYSTNEVMRVVGEAHEKLGQTVSDVPIRVKVQSSQAVDLGIVDLPGFRAFARDSSMQDLAMKIEMMNKKYMSDDNNVMLCVEEAGDAAGFSTLGKCKEVDPSYRRTILVRNKLDKYYNDLTAENINRWIEGYGDLPPNLQRFAVSLPHFADGTPSKPFPEMRLDCAERDVRTLKEKGASEKYAKTIGFANLTEFVDNKMQMLFADALSPMLQRMNSMKDDHDGRLSIIRRECENIDEDNILQHTRSVGISFAQSFNFMMAGILSSEVNRRTLDDELRAFNKFCDESGALTADDRSTGVIPDLESYITYLDEVVKVPGMNVQLNGGAQFRRLMYEVEVFTRFAGLETKYSKEDIIRLQGAGIHSGTWEDRIVKLLMQTAPEQMVCKAKYVAERLRWFFVEQKEATVEFMLGIAGSPEEHLYSNLLTKQAQVIQRNDTMKSCIFKTFDAACAKNKDKFLVMWRDYMDSMFQSPMKLLKSSSMPKEVGTLEDMLLPTFETTKQRIEDEVHCRVKQQSRLRDKIKAIPEDDFSLDTSFTMVQAIIEETFSFIRCQVADQMQLYSESFFLLPMLRRLEGEMAALELHEDDQKRYRVRKSALKQEEAVSASLVSDLEWCVAAVQTFKVTCGGSA